MSDLARVFIPEEGRGGICARLLMCRGRQACRVGVCIALPIQANLQISAIVLTAPHKGIERGKKQAAGSPNRMKHLKVA